eukprot:2963267-Rhodomonas_salina.3
MHRGVTVCLPETFDAMMMTRNLPSSVTTGSSSCWPVSALMPSVEQSRSRDKGCSRTKQRVKNCMLSRVESVTRTSADSEESIRNSTAKKHQRTNDTAHPGPQMVTSTRRYRDLDEQEDEQVLRRPLGEGHVAAG